MRSGVVFVVALSVLTATVLLFTANGLRSLWAADGAKVKADGPPPLVIDRSAPLLLDDPPTEKPKEKGPMADNQACFVCHGNYEEEEFALVHARGEVSCIECHGESFAHRDDEDNVTPPEIMYWPERIAEKCDECHETHDAAARDVLARWQERCPEKTDLKTVVCTDCHGYHRLKTRTVRWEKKTGKLIVGKPESTKRTPDPSP